MASSIEKAPSMNRSPDLPSTLDPIWSACFSGAGHPGAETVNARAGPRQLPWPRPEVSMRQRL